MWRWERGVEDGGCGGGREVEDGGCGGERV